MDQDLSQIQARIDADPEVQLALRSGSGTQHRLNVLRMMHRKGYSLPEGKEIDMKTGRIVDVWGPLQYGWRVAASLGAPFAAGQLSSAFGSASSAAPTAGTAAGSTVPPLTAGGTVPAVSGMGLTASAPTAAASTPWWQTTGKVAAIGAPAAVRLMGGGSPNGDGGGGASGPQDAQLNELMQLLINKAKRTEPVHEAAMQMAQRMAPSGVASPRMQANIQAASQPRKGPSTDPQVLAAIGKLMAGVK